MQQVLIKKFSLRRNGVVYKAGTIIAVSYTHLTLPTNSLV